MRRGQLSVERPRKETAYVGLGIENSPGVIALTPIHPAFFSISDSSADDFGGMILIACGESGFGALAKSDLLVGVNLLNY